MRSRSLAVMVIVAIGAVLACANMWFAGGRSLIPLSLDDRVQAGEVRFEKHPGIDDVYLITLESGRVLQVDASIFHRLAPGAHVHTQAWDRTMSVDGREENLWWSRDVQMLGRVMPLTVLVLSIVGVTAWRSGAQRG